MTPTLTTWKEAEDLFSALLDEPGPIVIAGLEFDPSRILRSVQPNDFRSMLFDFVDALGVDSDDLEGDLSVRYNRYYQPPTEGHTMFVNIDCLPRGKSLYTVYVTLDPAGTPRAETGADEVDVVAPSRAGKDGVLERGQENDGGANAGFYIAQTYGETARVVGIVDQSDGEVVYDAFKAGDA